MSFAGFAIGNVLERFVRRSLDEQLDAQAAILVGSVRSDGTIDRSRIVELPAFARGRGWAWRITGPKGSAHGLAELSSFPPRMPREIDLSDSPFRQGTPDRREHWHEDRGPGWGSVERRSVLTTSGAVVIVVTGPPRLPFEALRRALMPLTLSLAILGGYLVLAALLQLRFGLQPLRNLREAVAEVRAGKRRHVPEPDLREIAPLAAELNALIDENEAGLAHARRHVANLAHGLKTPLAALSVKIAESGCDPDGSLGMMVSQIDDRIRHHLGRARAAAPGSGRRARTMLAPIVEDLVAVLRGIHAERSIDAIIKVADDLTLSVDPRDLEELLGNLLDNAWRHARTTVHVTATSRGDDIELLIEDDGLGIEPTALTEALIPGKRFDERADGFGFGLSISQDLANLNGGWLRLSPSPDLGGLRVAVGLPQATKDD